MATDPNITLEIQLDSKQRETYQKHPPEATQNKHVGKRIPCAIHLVVTIVSDGKILGKICESVFGHSIIFHLKTKEMKSDDIFRSILSFHRQT